MSHNMLRAPASKIHPGITHHSDPTRQTTPVWFNQPHVEFKRLGDAMSALGPTILHVKKSTNKGKCITEYKCGFPNCKRRMRVVSPGDGPFSGPTYLTTLLACSHKVISWAEHYTRTLVVKRHGGIINVISPKIGLHSLVRAYTDILAMTQLQPKEISRKIQADFAMDLMFLQSCPVRDIITGQISHRIRLIRISIQFTHDVVSFKKQNLLCLPDDFQPCLIESETHLLELGRPLEKLGHLCGKKHKLQTDFPHCDLIVLEYDDVQDGSRC
jgi:hypothetical protein